MGKRREDTTCLLCGSESRDVGFGLVEFDEGERRRVKVAVPANHREGAVEIQLEVPERYAAMPRCRDEAACRERQAAVELAELERAAPIVEAVVESQPVEDETAWL